MRMSSPAELNDRILQQAIRAMVDVLAHRWVPVEEIEAAFEGEEQEDSMTVFQRLSALAEWHIERQDRPSLRV